MKLLEYIYIESIQKYKICLSMSWIIAIATLLLRSVCHFFGGKTARNGQYRLDIGLWCEISFQIRNQRLGFITWAKFQPLRARSKEVRNFKRCGNLKKDDVISLQRCHLETFFGYFGENLSNSISTPNFVMVQQVTTKLVGGSYNAPPPPPYCHVFKTAHTE